MGALAQAMAKAGVVEAEKANSIDNLRKIQTLRYQALSGEIRSMMKEKRPLKELLRALIGDGSMTTERLKKCAWDFFKMPADINFAIEVNRQMLTGMVQDKLDSIEKDLRPRLKESKKLEADWGFTRDGSHQR